LNPNVCAARHPAALLYRFFVWLGGVSPFFNRDGGCKQKITLWLSSFKRASFFVRFEGPFLRPGLGTEGR
jgi:hypothetical protein